MKNKILLIDDDKSIHDILEAGLDQYQLYHSYNGSESLKILSKESIDIILCDLVLPDINGIKLIKKIKSNYDIPIIMITGFASIESAIEAIKAGAYDYLKKPFSIKEVNNRLKKVLEHEQLKNENIRLMSILSGTPEGLGIVYTSEVMSNIIELIKKIAPYNINVLILGESGVGKELVANAIHKLSNRSDNQLIAINCSGIPETLLESELFGYTKGAFTGAIKDKDGLIVKADNGTMFFDEIGDASPEFQVKILRILDSGTYTPIGSTSIKNVNIRLVSATNKDVDKLLSQKTLREDLYYRINGITINIPPLRERREDIGALAKHFLKLFSNDQKEFSRNALLYLIQQNWKGNVRELKNVIQKVSILTKNKIISVNDFKYFNKNISYQGIEYRDAKCNFEMIYFQTLYKQCNGKITEMAKQSGLTRQNIYIKLNKFNINM